MTQQVDHIMQLADGHAQEILDFGWSKGNTMRQALHDAVKRAVVARYAGNTGETTPDKTAELAKQAGFRQECPTVQLAFVGFDINLFAELVHNAALEEAAVLCDGLQDVPATEPRHCAQDIRGLKS